MKKLWSAIVVACLAGSFFGMSAASASPADAAGIFPPPPCNGCNLPPPAHRPICCSQN